MKSVMLELNLRRRRIRIQCYCWVRGPHRGEWNNVVESIRSKDIVNESIYEENKQYKYKVSTCQRVGGKAWRSWAREDAKPVSE